MSIEDLQGTGVLWQGRNSDVLDVQHLLYEYEVEVAQNGMDLLLIRSEGDPVQVNMGDEVVLDEETDQIGIIRSDEAHGTSEQPRIYTGPN